MGPVATTVQWRENPLIVQGGRQMRLASKGGNRKQETGNDSSFWPRFLVAASTLGHLNINHYGIRVNKKCFQEKNDRNKSLQKFTDCRDSVLYVYR